MFRAILYCEQVYLEKQRLIKNGLKLFRTNRHKVNKTYGIVVKRILLYFFPT